MKNITCERYHDFSAGHRVAGHESKCAHLHGHNYRVHFECQAMPAHRDFALDALGRVIDFGVIKERLCTWLEENWDHRTIIWSDDPIADDILALDNLISGRGMQRGAGVVLVPFNPTAENMADYLLNTVGPTQLVGTGVQLVRVRIEETAKCSATVTLGW